MSGLASAPSTAAPSGFFGSPLAAEIFEHRNTLNTAPAPYDFNVLVKRGYYE